MYDHVKTNKIIDDGVGQFFAGVFRLREDGLHQEAYEALGAMLSICQQDRQLLRETQSIQL